MTVVQTKAVEHYSFLVQISQKDIQILCTTHILCTEDDIISDRRFVNFDDWA